MAVDRARAVVEDLVENNRVGYAVTTGVGQLSDVRIPPDDIRQLQVNLLRSHAVGLGDPLSQEVTRAMILLRANSLAKGCSGVRGVVIDTLCELLNRGVHPVIPSQGSVGASGDLAPLVAPGVGPHRRGRGSIPRQAYVGRGSLEASWYQAARAGSERNHLPHQRDAGHVGGGIAGHDSDDDSGRHRGRSRGPGSRRAERHRCRFRRAHPLALGPIRGNCR